jgi:hypothetical protein
MTEPTEYLEVDEQPRRSQTNEPGGASWLNQPVHYDGETNTLAEWVARAGMKRSTVLSRITQQRMTPLAALCKPDRNGNHLPSLTPQHERPGDSKTLSWTLHLEPFDLNTRHGPTRVSARYRETGETIDLGAFNSRNEAIHAANTAAALLESDRPGIEELSLESSLDADRADLAEQQARDRIAAFRNN